MRRVPHNGRVHGLGDYKIEITSDCLNSFSSPCVLDDPSPDLAHGTGADAGQVLGRTRTLVTHLFLSPVFEGRGHFSHDEVSLKESEYEIH